MTMITEFANDKKELSAQVAELTAEYIANGGKITKVKMGKKALGQAIDLTSNEKVSGEVK